MLRRMLRRRQGEERECRRGLQGRGNQATGEAYPSSTVVSNLFIAKGGTRERKRAEIGLPKGINTDKGAGVNRHFADARKGCAGGAGGTDASEYNDTGLGGTRPKTWHRKANGDKSGTITDARKSADQRYEASR